MGKAVATEAQRTLTMTFEEIQVDYLYTNACCGSPVFPAWRLRAGLLGWSVGERSLAPFVLLVGL